VSAAGLHLGIWLTMWPNYFPQTFCYLLGVYWPVPDKWSVVAHTMPQMQASGVALFVAWMSVALCGVLTVIALLKLEYWPFTGIPMYSFYRDASYDYKWLRDARQAQVYEWLAVLVVVGGGDDVAAVSDISCIFVMC